MPTAMRGQTAFGENEVCFGCGVPVGKPVADEDARSIRAVQESHHSRLARRAAVRADLLKEREICAPITRAFNLQLARADAHVAQQPTELQLWTLKDAADAVVEAVADDVRRNLMTGADFEQQPEPFVHLNRTHQALDPPSRGPHKRLLRSQATARADAPGAPLL